MAGRLQAELKQSRPFPTVEEEVLLNLMRTTDALMQPLNALLKEHAVSGTQYNVLRILRGAGSQGLACGAIGERMITRDPDITRLLDRLEKRGLVERNRDAHDRRVITVRITKQGLSTITALDAPIDRLHRSLLGHLGIQRLRALIELLEAARLGGSTNKEK